MGKVWMPGGGGGGSGSDDTTATSEYVLTGKTYIGSDTDDEVGTGTMADKSGTTQSASGSLDTSNSRVQLTIPSAGRYTATSKLYIAYSTLASLIGATAAKLAPSATILGITGTYTSDGTASASDILSGKIAYSKGTKLTGSRESMAGQTITPSTSNQTVSCSGKYMTGNVVVNGDSNLVASNIKKGVTIWGVTGTWEGYTEKSNYLYQPGLNSAGFYDYDSISNTTLTEGSRYLQLAIDTTSTASINFTIASTKTYSTSNYTSITVDFQPYGAQVNSITVGYGGGGTDSLYETVAAGTRTTKTITMSNKNNQNEVIRLRFVFASANVARGAYIHNVYLS